MATIHTCDHTDHGQEQVEAVASVQLKKTDDKSKNVVNVVKSRDACAEHVGELTQAAFKSGSLDPKFHSVDVYSWRKTGE